MIWVVIIGSICCVIVLWILGNQLRKNVTIQQLLKKKKNSLAPGYSVNEKWHKLNRKSILLILVFSIGIIIIILLSIIFLNFSIRWYYILLGGGVSSLLGYFGIVIYPDAD